jgi:SAM-dependent methyltransferase
MLAQNDNTWRGAYKIPWDDPDFSRRMLAEHLAQGHDMASRRADWIDKQVAWIHNTLLKGKPSSILDLGCGPGFYSHRLATRGHQCLGIDFGPASIEYAQQHNPDESQCNFTLGDIRRVAFGGPYDLAMILYGELNVFSPAEVSEILCKVQASLRPKGRLIIEIQTPEAVERVGRSTPSEQQSESGLFSDQPHQCRIESQWLPEQNVAVQTFSVSEATSRQMQIYRNTTQAWPDCDLVALLAKVGFYEAAQCNGWPCNLGELKLWVAHRA